MSSTRSGKRAVTLDLGDPRGQELGGERSSGGALAGTRGSVKEIGVGCSTAGSQRRPDHGPGVRMAVELGEHGIDASGHRTRAGVRAGGYRRGSCVDG